MSTKIAKRPTIYSALGAPVNPHQRLLAETFHPEVKYKREQAIALCRSEANKIPVMVAKGTWKLIEPADLHLWHTGPDGISRKVR